MTEKQEHLLQLFRELDEICKKNNLRYVMAGGTAIGVVRNEGFIPWDDDVDIYMPRDDWNKLVEISGSVLPEHRALIPILFQGMLLRTAAPFTSIRLSAGTVPVKSSTCSPWIPFPQMIRNMRNTELI